MCWDWKRAARKGWVESINGGDERKKIKRVKARKDITGKA